MLKGFPWIKIYKDIYRIYTDQNLCKVIPKIVDVEDESSAFGTWDDSLG